MCLRAGSRKFQRKKKSSTEQVAQPPSQISSSDNTGKNNPKAAAQKWTRSLLGSDLREVRKQFVEAVKPYMPPGSREAFSQEANFEKNRYDDVELLDKTRVKIKDAPDGSDYIHASFVQVSPKVLIICAQGPLEATIQHFWIMIIEQSCKVVLQLCQFMEDGKEKTCPYFPTVEQGAEKEYGAVKVRVVSRNMGVGNMKMVERTLLEVTFGTKILETTHLLFSGWPDHSVPDLFPTYIEMRSLIRRLADKGPIVAHCSAGIGRSGSYAAIEMACYELIERQNRNFSMVELMKRLRDQRMQAVQNDQQYLFIHRMVLEILLAEKTIEATSQLHKFCKKYDELIERKKAEIADLKKRK